MSEPRMRARPKGSQFAVGELEAMLTAFGDTIHQPLPETIRTLDEIITDFIIESSHLSTLPSQLAHRSKIKIDDFKFALRKDPKKLGRVTELLSMDKDIKRRRRAFEVEEGAVVGQGVGRGKGKRGRKRKGTEADGEGGADVDMSDEEGEDDGKSRKSGRSGGGVAGKVGSKRGRKKRKTEADGSEGG